MVLRVFPDRILLQRAEVSDHAYQPFPGAQWPDQDARKHDAGDPSRLYGDAYAQIDTTEEIKPTEQGGEDGAPTFREDGHSSVDGIGSLLPLMLLRARRPPGAPGGTPLRRR